MDMDNFMKDIDPEDYHIFDYGEMEIREIAIFIESQKPKTTLQRAKELFESILG